MSIIKDLARQSVQLAQPKAKRFNDPLVETDTDIPPDFTKETTIPMEFQLSSRISIGAQAEGIPSWPAASSKLEEAHEVPTAPRCAHPIEGGGEPTEVGTRIEQKWTHSYEFIRIGEIRNRERGIRQTVARDEEHNRANSPQLQISLPNPRLLVGRNGAPTIQYGPPCYRVRGYGT